MAPISSSILFKCMRIITNIFLLATALPLRVEANLFYLLHIFANYARDAILMIVYA